MYTYFKANSTCSSMFIHLIFVLLQLISPASATIFFFAVCNSLKNTGFACFEEKVSHLVDLNMNTWKILSSYLFCHILFFVRQNSFTNLELLWNYTNEITECLVIYHNYVFFLITCNLCNLSYHFFPQCFTHQCLKYNIMSHEINDKLGQSYVQVKLKGHQL